MLRTLLFLVFIVVATVFLPFWLQAVFYILALFFIPNKIFLLLPAMIADAWYSPVRTFSFENNKTTLFVIALLFFYFLIVNNTRISQKYGLEKK
jgi:hypothetical protein